MKENDKLIQFGFFGPDGELDQKKVDEAKKWLDARTENPEQNEFDRELEHIQCQTLLRAQLLEVMTNNMDFLKEKAGELLIKDVNKRRKADAKRRQDERKGRLFWKIMREIDPEKHGELVDRILYYTARSLDYYISLSAETRESWSLPPLSEIVVRNPDTVTAFMLLYIVSKMKDVFDGYPQQFRDIEFVK